jgi:hypothetical protein
MNIDVTMEGIRYDYGKRTYVIDEERMAWARRIISMVADGTPSMRLPST